jgi:hypothetical protein
MLLCGATVRMLDGRELVSYVIVKIPNQVLRLSEKLYEVASQSGSGPYDVAEPKASSTG